MILVVVNVHALTYTRYHGRKATHRAVSDRPLTVEEVEVFRSTPWVLLPQGGPGVA